MVKTPKKIDWHLRERLLYDTCKVLQALDTDAMWLPLDNIVRELLKIPFWAKHRGGISPRMLVGYLYDLDIAPDKRHWNYESKKRSGFELEYLVREWNEIQAEKAGGR